LYVASPTIERQLDQKIKGFCCIAPSGQSRSEVLNVDRRPASDLRDDVLSGGEAIAAAYWPPPADERIEHKKIYRNNKWNL
jgi:hypothetical protein